MPKKKYVVKNHTLYVKVDNGYYTEYPSRRLIQKEELVGFKDETDDLEWAVYQFTCSNCPGAKSCHENAYNSCGEDPDSEYSKMLAFGEEEI